MLFNVIGSHITKGHMFCNIQVINFFLFRQHPFSLFHHKLFNPISLKLTFYIIIYYIKCSFTSLIYFMYPVTKEYYFKMTDEDKKYVRKKKKKG